jgi:glutaconyl-CoA decarboxylase
MAKYEVSIEGKRYEVEIIRDDGQRALLNINGREIEVEARNVTSGSAPAANPSPAPRPASAPSARPAAGGGAGANQIVAPMPGLVLQVIAAVGQTVKDGEAVIRLEAMKMENDIQCHFEGTVKEIRVAQGDEVQEGDVLMVLEG